MSFRRCHLSVGSGQIPTGHRADVSKYGMVLTLLSVVLLSSACSEKVSSAAQALPLNSVAVGELENPPSAGAVEPEVEAKRSSRSAPSEETLLQQRELFRQGYRLYQAKKYEEARALLQQALEVYPILADYSLYALGAISRDEGDSAEAQRLFQRLLAKHPDSVWNGRATLELAKLALGEQDWRKAARYAEQTRDEKSSPALVRNEAIFILAQAREKQGELADAYNLYQELRRVSPRSAFGKAAKEHVDQLRATDPSHFRLDTDREYLDEIRLLHKGGEGRQCG